MIDVNKSLRLDKYKKTFLNKKYFSGCFFRKFSTGLGEGFG